MGKVSFVIVFIYSSFLFAFAELEGLKKKKKKKKFKVDLLKVVLPMSLYFYEDLCDCQCSFYVGI